MLKEALALKNALTSLGSVIAGKRIKAFVDNKAVYFGWLQQKSRSADLNIIMKEILQFTLQLNFSLEITFVPSGLNPSGKKLVKIRRHPDTPYLVICPVPLW